jgi:hypothetical protein
MLRGESLIPDQPYQNALHFLNAHIDMLNHSPIQHARGDIPPTSFLLQVVETLQNDAFPMGETVTNVWKIVARIMGRHMKVSPRRAYPEFRCDALWWYMEKFSHPLLAYFCRLSFNVLSDSLSNEIYTGHIQPFLLIPPLDQSVKFLYNFRLQT